MSATRTEGKLPPAAFARLAALYAGLLLAACADAVPTVSPVCDGDDPCAAGSTCVAGFCQPVAPREDTGVPPPMDEGPGAPDGGRDRGVDLPDLAAAGDMAPSPADRGMASPDMASPDMRPPDPDMASPDMRPPALDMRPPDPDMAPPDDCGRFGQGCCPGARCVTGGCLDGTCVAFGGVWAEHGESGDRLCSGNPLVGGACACPPNFIDQHVADLDGNVDEGSGWITSLHVCAPAVDDPLADFRGAFGQDTDIRDPDRCVAACQPGPTQPGCGCPAGSDPLVYDGVRYRTNPNPDCIGRMTLCHTPAPLTFGGAYRVYRAGNVVCDEIPQEQRCDPNPLTAACACPPRFVPVTMPLMGPHKSPARGYDWFCRADLTICVGSP